MVSNTNAVLQSAITGLQKSIYAGILAKAGLPFTANALQNGNQPSGMLTNPAQSFDAVLNSAVGQNDVISKLRSFGVPVNIVNTSYKPKKLGLLGISIAPNIIKKMEQDEEYAQEIFDEISYFMYNFLPDAEQKYALQGARIKHYEMSIKSDGKVVMACGGVHIEKDEDCHGGIELLVFTTSGKKDNNIEVSSETLNLNVKDDIDLLAYLSLVGDTSFKSHSKVNQ